MEEKNRVGRTLVAIFLLLFGICMILLGGGCSVFLVVVIWSGSTEFVAGLLVSILIAGAGVMAVLRSIRLLGGRD